MVYVGRTLTKETGSKQSQSCFLTQRFVSACTSCLQPVQAALLFSLSLSPGFTFHPSHVVYYCSNRPLGTTRPQHIPSKQFNQGSGGAQAG